MKINNKKFVQLVERIVERRLNENKKKYRLKIKFSPKLSIKTTKIEVEASSPFEARLKAYKYLCDDWGVNEITYFKVLSFNASGTMDASI